MPSSPVAEALHRLDALGRPEGALRLHAVAQESARRDGQDSAETCDPRLAELTPAERRVVVLAMDGWGNSEIARRLFITMSTVEQHLTKAYRKLGVKSRGELRLSTRHATTQH